jgi:adenylate kinase
VASGDVVLMGPPGSGKGTQAKLLAGDPGWIHLSTGDLFRKHLREGTDLGKLADGYMSQGRYVPDDVTVGMVRERMREIRASERVVFDGFPRTVPQAEALETLLGEMGRRVARVVLIEVDREHLAERLARRSEGRTDDSPEVARKRFDVYMEQTRPVVDHYDRKGLLRRVGGLGSVEDVHARLKAAI